MKIQLFALVLFGLLMWGAVFLRLQSGAVERRRPVVRVYDPGVKTDLRGARNQSGVVKKDVEGVKDDFIKKERDWSIFRILEKIRSIGLKNVIERHTGVLPKYHACSVVGSSSQLLKYDLGRTIDTYDAVFRSNNAPTKNYERKVGSKTTVRGYNPVIELKSLSKDFSVSIQHIDPEFIRSPDKMRQKWLAQNKNGRVNIFTKSLVIELCNYMTYVAQHSTDYDIHRVFWDWFEGKSKKYWHPDGESIPRFSPKHCSTGLVTVLDAIMMCDEVVLFGYSGCNGFDTSFGKEHYYNNKGVDQFLSKVQKRYASAQTNLISLLTKDSTIKCAFTGHDDPCRRMAQLNIQGSHDCAVVGSSGILKGSGLGEEIDNHDIILRMNLAPVKGYESDVGTRTDIRIINCPSFPAVNKRSDAEKLEYLHAIDPSSNARIISCSGPSGATLWTDKFRNNCLYRKNIFSTTEMNRHKATRKRRYEPAFGFETVIRALYSCSRVHVYGMSDPSTDDVPYHYYVTGPEWKKEWKDRHNGDKWDFYKAHNFAMENNKLKEWESKSFIEITQLANDIAREKNVTSNSISTKKNNIMSMYWVNNQRSP